MNRLSISGFLFLGSVAAVLILLVLGDNSNSQRQQTKQTCDPSSSFVSLFRELHGAGSYFSVWLGGSGDAQMVTHSGRVITRLEAGTPDAATVNRTFDEVRSTFEFDSRSWYPPIVNDESIDYESGHNLLQFNNRGSCLQLLFHESNSEAEPFKALVKSFESLFATTTPSSPAVDAQFLIASPMLSQQQFPMESLTNWYSRLVDRPGDLPIYSVNSLEDIELAEVRAAVTMPGRFVEISHSATGIDELADSVFYVQVDGGDTFFVRRMDFRSNQ